MSRLRPSAFDSPVDFIVNWANYSEGEPFKRGRYFSEESVDRDSFDAMIMELDAVCEDTFVPEVVNSSIANRMLHLRHTRRWLELLQADWDKLTSSVPAYRDSKVALVNRSSSFGVCDNLAMVGRCGLAAINGFALRVSTPADHSDGLYGYATLPLSVVDQLIDHPLGLTLPLLVSQLVSRNHIVWAASSWQFHMDFSLGEAAADVVEYIEEVEEFLASFEGGESCKVGLHDLTLPTT